MDAVIEAANVYGAAVLALASTDSIAVSQQGELAENYLDRKTIYRVQTPQAFRLHLLEEAEIAAEQEKQPFTDEGSMVLKTLGVRPKIVLGHRKNEKITTAMDLGERL